MRNSARVLLILLLMTVPATAKEPSTPASSGLPPHLVHWPGLYVRQEQRIVEAPAEDQVLAKSYPSWPSKGALSSGMRITLLTKKTRYALGEEIHVIHVFEAPGSGMDVYVMGPKFVYGEAVDGTPVSGPPELKTYPWLGVYDGAVLKSPAVDYNYDITTYRFSEPGTHVISWQLGPLRSNSITVEIGEGTPGAASAEPLFQYAEDSDTVFFLVPRSVRIARVRNGSLTVCQYGLSEHGNMWSGPDVEKSFRAAEIQSLLTAPGAPYASDSTGRLTAGAVAIVWASACKKCREQPVPLRHLRDVLRTVMLNARLLCK